MNVPHQNVSCRIPELWYNVVSKWVWYYAESSVCVSIRGGKCSQKHNCEYIYMAKLWCLLTIENYMFRLIAAIIRFGHLSCYKRYIWYAYYI